MSKKNIVVYLFFLRKEGNIYIQGLAGLVAHIFNYLVSGVNPAIESSAKEQLQVLVLRKKNCIIIFLQARG